MCYKPKPKALSPQYSLYRLYRLGTVCINQLGLALRLFVFHTYWFALSFSSWTNWLSFLLAS